MGFNLHYTVTTPSHSLNTLHWAYKLHASPRPSTVMMLVFNVVAAINVLSVQLPMLHAPLHFLSSVFFFFGGHFTVRTHNFPGIR